MDTRTKQNTETMYVHHIIQKDEYYRTALIEVDTKKVGDIIKIKHKSKDEDWVITEIAQGPIIDQHTFQNVLKYNKKLYYNTPRLIVKIVKSESHQNSAKKLHETFTYDNRYTFETWIESDDEKNTITYFGKLLSPLIKDKQSSSIYSITVPKQKDNPLIGTLTRDAWDFGSLFVAAEDEMTEQYNKQKLKNNITESVLYHLNRINYES